MKLSLRLIKVASRCTETNNQRDELLLSICKLYSSDKKLFSLSLGLFVAFGASGPNWFLAERAWVEIVHVNRTIDKYSCIKTPATFFFLKWFKCGNHCYSACTWAHIISSRLVPATLTQIARNSSWKWC